MNDRKKTDFCTILKTDKSIKQKVKKIWDYIANSLTRVACCNMKRDEKMHRGQQKYWPSHIPIMTRKITLGCYTETKLFNTINSNEERQALG